MYFNTMPSSVKRGEKSKVERNPEKREKEMSSEYTRFYFYPAINQK